MAKEKNSERTEDLNPRSDDIEEKVKRMLDLSVPDAPATEIKATSSKKDDIKVVTVGSVANLADKSLPSAPELPKESKKIPVSHEDEPAVADKAELESEQPKVKQIIIEDHNESTSDVAKELDEAIAGLGPEETKETEKTTETDEEAALAEPVDYSPVIDSPETDKAVNDIIASEGDELLEIEDAILDTDQPVEQAKKSKKGLGKTLKAWLSKPVVRWSAGIILVGGLIVAGVYPRSRYLLLNTAGVRASSSVVVLDESTQLPLKNVQVKLAAASGTTDVNGKVSLSKIKLGPAMLTIEKRGFAPINRSIIIGLGSNPLGDFKLTSTGSQYTFTVTDFLSGKPVSKVEASSNEASALSNDKGVIKLIIDIRGDEKIAVTIQGEGYRQEKFEIDPADKSDHVVKLVPSRKQTFVTKRSGKYDIYSVYIDGKDETLVLTGSGSERDDMVLVPHPSAETLAYVSTRGNQHNSDGYLLSNLILINTSDNTTTNVAMSEQLQIIDWSGDYLVYVAIASGSSADSPNRFRLVTYNFRDGGSKELAHANYFNDVVAAGGAVYYSPSSAYQSTPSNFYKISPSGTDAKTIFNQEVWNIIRSSYDHFALSVEQQWYDYRLGDSAPTKLGNAPADQNSRVYVDSPDGKRSIWSEIRDGKGTLLSYDLSAKSDTSLQSQSGLVYPMRWLSNNVVIYRVKTDQESADYAVSTDGGKPVKIRDVTNSGGIDRWYH